MFTRLVKHSSEIASTLGNNPAMLKRVLITFSACALNRLLFWRYYMPYRREIMERGRVEEAQGDRRIKGEREQECEEKEIVGVRRRR